MSHYLTLKAVGRPVAYFPGLAKRLGSTNAAILLGQFIYWHDKAQSELGVYKSVDEIEEETGLSYKSQRTARKILTDLGLITETEKRLEHRIYFKFNEAVFEAWLDANEHGQSANCPKGSSGVIQSEVGGQPKGQSVIQEITTEITTEKKACATAKAPDAVQNLFEQFWSAYPNKKDKKNAWAKFSKINFTKNPFEKIMSSLTAFKQSEDWQKNNGKYVPMPTTWINGERWNDEFQTTPTNPNADLSKDRIVPPEQRLPNVVYSADGRPLYTRADTSLPQGSRSNLALMH